MNRYYKTTKENTFIEVRTGYELGGMSYFSGQTSRRGYYVYVSPIETDGVFVRRTLFHGFKHLLVEVKRQSTKQAELAERLVLDVADGFAQKAAEEEGLTLTGEFEEKL